MARIPAGHTENFPMHSWRPLLVTQYGSLITVRCSYCYKERVATNSETMIFYNGKTWGWDHNREEVEAIRVAHNAEVRAEEYEASKVKGVA